MRSILAAVLLAFLLSPTAAFGASIITAVTSASLTQGGISFALKSTPSAKGTTFSATITVPQATTSIYSASLGTVTQVDGLASITGSREIRLEKESDTYRTSFKVSRKTLGPEGLCFIFREQIQTMRDGKLMPMPSANFYTLRLKDFTE